MIKYNVNVRKLALLLLPTFLRRPLLVALTCAAVSPLGYIHNLFAKFRGATSYTLTHNGQACYLRAVLNDYFDEGLRRITVTDPASSAGLLLIYHRQTDREVLVPIRSSDRTMLISGRGFGGASSIDFVVNIPIELRGLDEVRLKAVVNTYKLVSKRFAISYI